MKHEFDGEKSIYLQIAESIEDETQVLSTNQLALMYGINPATAAKGIKMLVDEGGLYKKRGIGMFVSSGAVKKIRKKRKAAFYDKFIVPIMDEAANLNISEDEISEMIRKRSG